MFAKRLVYIGEICVGGVPGRGSSKLKALVLGIFLGDDVSEVYSLESGLSKDFLPCAANVGALLKDRYRGEALCKGGFR